MCDLDDEALSLSLQGVKLIKSIAAPVQLVPLAPLQAPPPPPPPLPPPLPDNAPPVIPPPIANNIPPAIPRHSRPRNKPGDGHVCQFNNLNLFSANYNNNGLNMQHRCLLCFCEHADCVLINSKKTCTVCGRQAEECDEQETKASYLIKKIERLHKENR